MSRIAWAAVAAVLLASPALAVPLPSEPLIGRASVIDGDTLEIAGKRVRLHGVDTPESAQTCLNADGAAWRCGQRAALALSDRLGQRTVTCRPRDVDRYGRIVAACSVGGRDVGRWLVSQGWAVAYRQYSKDYVSAEDAARVARRGIWAGTFTPPDEWRRERRARGAAKRLGAR
ncbi:thermonuclease family protein [Caulobacter sp. 17J80-11]|uniref:thermonuclease family protein n=1 Tax=Caulobacter sp. 17J80-11 TaxID=2763502 RepID=UPI001CA45B44